MSKLQALFGCIRTTRSTRTSTRSHDRAQIDKTTYCESQGEEEVGSACACHGRTSWADGERVVVVPYGGAGVGAPQRAVERARRAVLRASHQIPHQNHKNQRTLNPLAPEAQHSTARYLVGIHGWLINDDGVQRARSRYARTSREGRHTPPYL